jgi:hypothetical protein
MSLDNLVGGKRVDLDLVGQDGNAFNLLGLFQRQARREGWTKAEIDLVIDAATKGSYSNLLTVLMVHCK